MVAVTPILSVTYEIKANVCIKVGGVEDLESDTMPVPLSPFEVRFTLENGKLRNGACVIVYGWRRYEYEGEASSCMGSEQYRRFDGEWSNENTPDWLKGAVAGAEHYAMSRGWEGTA